MLCSRCTGKGNLEAADTNAADIAVASSASRSIHGCAGAPAPVTPAAMKIGVAQAPFPGHYPT